MVLLLYTKEDVLLQTENIEALNHFYKTIKNGKYW